MQSAFFSVYPEIRERLSKLVQMDFPHPFRPPAEGRRASVLLLCGIRSRNDQIEILITRRTSDLPTHSGQYALPGGVHDVEDGAPGIPETAVAAAFRETEEEMGIGPELIESFGVLPEIWTPSGFRVTPVLGLLRAPIEDVLVRPNLQEIDHWFWCPLDKFRAEGVYRTEKREIRLGETSRSVPVDVYQVEAHRIWGMTGAILKNFIGRWEKLG